MQTDVAGCETCLRAVLIPQGLLETSKDMVTETEKYVQSETKHQE